MYTTTGMYMHCDCRQLDPALEEAVALLLGTDALWVDTAEGDAVLCGADIDDDELSLALDESEIT